MKRTLAALLLRSSSRRSAAVVCCSLLGGLLAVSPATAKDQAPRLIVQITVDALRGDLPQRFAHVLGEGGFRHLQNKGVDYRNAHYQHANTETIVGHASLATGTVPAAHGMVANVWFDREQGRLAYNIEDPDYHLLTPGADVDRKTEIEQTINDLLDVKDKVGDVSGSL